MKKFNELKYTELKTICDPNMFKFETTQELEDMQDGLGQERGIRALEFGINVDIRGYNLFLEGPSGVGKTTYAKNYLEAIAKKKKVPNDWCYIYNFDNPNEPIAISLPAGQGKEFKQDVDDFINDIKTDIKGTFNNDDFEKEKSLIKKDFEEKKSVLLEKLTKDSLKQGFQVKTAQNGIYIMPVLNGKTIEEEEFEKLDDSVKADFENKSASVQEKIIETMGEIKAMEKTIDKKVDEWQSNIALLTINVHINAMKNKYKRNKKITKFLDNIKTDVLKNLTFYINEDTSNNKQQQNTPGKPETPNPSTNYKVNLFIDNSGLEGAPIIMDNNYSYNSLFGKLEYENQYGVLKTDYTMLKPGLLHHANGGFIILQAKDLLSNALCWEILKKSLRVKELIIENPADQRAAMVMVALKPEPIPLNVKVLLVGSTAMYHTLLSLDEDFRKLFKIKVEFEESAPRTEENILKIAQFVQTFCKRENVPHLDREAMAKVIEFTSRLTEDKNKISTEFYEILEIVSEACTWAQLDKAKIVTKDYITKALSERIDRVKKYDQKYLEMIQDHTLLINTSGLKIGEINGLTIVSIGDYTFGKPSKITVNTYIGKDKIVNIEREVELSGSSHSKGIYILNGYIGEKFAQDIPLSLTASICFEQLYNGVDGDSASSTEVYALLSSLSEIPIDQSIAVTGSVNQKGDIQPIGGVNEKIEGFFQICKMRGLTGKNGVIIPIQNIKNLHLADEVIDAVKNNLFHIYSVSTIDEGIEILTGVPAGKIDASGNYPRGTVNFLAYEKLKKYAQKALENSK